MTLVAILRHGPTAWNAAGRIQGHTDEPLSTAGRGQMTGLALPPELSAAAQYCSPLARAVETAKIVGMERPRLEPRLMEMSWGTWEGCTLAELRAQGGEAMAANEARGLDFMPEGGESPAMVQARLKSWLAEVAEAGETVAAVSHRGIVRALLAMATGWDMTGKPPVKLDMTRLQVFRLEAGGRPTLEAANLALIQKDSK